jgi:hypothetical protein
VPEEETVNIGFNFGVFTHDYMLSADYKKLNEEMANPY